MKLLLKPGLEFSDGKSAIYGLSRRSVEALRACVSVGQPRTASSVRLWPIASLPQEFMPRNAAERGQTRTDANDLIRISMMPEN